MVDEAPSVVGEMEASDVVDEAPTVVGEEETSHFE